MNKRADGLMRHERADFTRDEWSEIRTAFIEDDSLELTRAQRAKAPNYVLEEWIWAVGGLEKLRTSEPDR